MFYFSSRDLSAISLFSSLWAILNWILAPIVWNLTHLPILCDMVGMSLLILTAWWTRKPGAAFLMAVITTLLNFILRPGAFQFLGFTAASAMFDISTSVMAYREKLDGRWVDHLSLIGASVVSSIFAGTIIGSFFMNVPFSSKSFGRVSVFAALHGFGGLLGGLLGVNIIRHLEARDVFSRELKCFSKF